MTTDDLRKLALAATPPCANCCVRLDCFCHCCALADAMTTERVLAMIAVVKAAQAMRERCRYEVAGQLRGAACAFDAALAELEGMK